MKSLPVLLAILVTSFLLDSVSAADVNASAETVRELNTWLKTSPDKRTPLEKTKFATTPLTKADAEKAIVMLVDDHHQHLLRTRREEMKNKRIQIGNHVMKFDFTVFGKKPKDGRSLYISMHGGGGAPARVNDQQWENQKRLYRPGEGIYLSPRAPTNTWNLWHQGHIDPLFDRLIENLILFQDVNPNRVYLMGYSAGGDGVYQLAPRMADRWAACAMMAGHPNETSPLGLRNIGFTLHVGANDSGYNRNKIAAEWKTKLAELQKADPKGYQHLVKIHPGRGHWMNLQDAVAVPWMAKFERNLLPERIVWKQDDVTHTRFYWLAVPPEEAKPRREVIVERNGDQFTIVKSDADELIIRLNDEMFNLDTRFGILSAGNNGKVELVVTASRTIKTIYTTLKERGDPTAIFTAELKLKVR